MKFNKGLTCYSCGNVASPDHCQQRTICGQDEVCTTEEYRDYLGRQAFRLGCANRKRCTLYKDALALISVGRRDADEDHSSHCVKCCSDSDCNREQCQGAVQTSPQTTTPSPPIDNTCRNSTGTTCLDCEGVTSPDVCRETTECGENGECYTEEYMDADGRQSFRLGCIDTAKCTWLNSINILGKRDTSTCFKCCSDDACNEALCNDVVTSHPTSTVTSPGNACQRVMGCPDDFLLFKDHCYMFAPGGAFRYQAADYCHQRKAKLLTLHSQEEHDFLKQHMNRFNASYITGFWTGAYYSHQLQSWQWEDGTTFDYAPWFDNHRASIYNYTYNYYAVLSNPAYGELYTDAPLWYPTVDTDTYGVVCKIKKT